MAGTSPARIPLQLSQNCVIASIQIDLSDDILRQFRQDLLERLHSSGATGVILDVAGIDIMDLQDFKALQQTISMATLMGAQTVIIGLRPGVVSALVELEADVDWVNAALNLDEAFSLINRLRSIDDKPTGEEEPHESAEDMDQNN